MTKSFRLIKEKYDDSRNKSKGSNIHGKIKMFVRVENKCINPKKKKKTQQFRGTERTHSSPHYKWIKGNKGAENYENK